MFEHARWIWRENGAPQNSVTRFRTAFRLDARPSSCRMSVSAHHFYRFWVNGVEVGGLSSPAPSNFDARKLYLTYEIGEYLRKGENVFAFSVLFLGGQGQNRTCGCPCLIFEAEGTSENGTFCIASGTGCRASAVSGYLPGLPLRERRGMTGSTCFDASREEPGWKLPGFDDSGWENAVLSPANLLVPALDPQEIPEGAVLRTWEPALLHTEPGFALYDAGEVLTGFVRVTLSGSKGDRLRLRYGELLEGQRRSWSNYREPRPDAVMRVEHSAVNDETEYYLDDYIASGGTEVWAECFTYKAFRYFELTFPESCKILRVEAVKTGTGAPAAGEFSCDSPLLNRMAEACLNTQKNNIMGILVDCPHREQAEYLGDSLMQSRLLCYNFPGARELLRKVLQDFADTQLYEGDFPFVAPVDWTPGSSFMLKMPEYDLLYPEILWQLWKFYADWDALGRFYPTAAKTAAFYLSVRDADGLIPKVIREGEPVMHISDWPYSSIDEEGDALFVENAYLLMGLGRLAEISSLLNRPGDHAYWLAERTRLAGAIRNAFFDPEAGLFRDTPVSEKHHPGVNALAAEAGLFRTGELAGAMKYLASAPYETRVILSWNYLKTLFENGCRQKAFDLLADPSARWGLMVSQGSKTIWEGFEDIESHSHAWNCYPLRLLQEYIAGIRCAAPGFTETEITPFFPEGLYEFSARVCAAGGVIEVQGWRSETGAKFQVELPEGVSGVFRYGEVEQPLEEGLTEVEITL